MPEQTPGGLRGRKKAETRRSIQDHAMRLFLRDGFDATTVEKVAAAANVSPMTCYRYFPTKEDLVLSDDYDALIVGCIDAEPDELRPAERIRRGVVAAFKMVWLQDRELVLARSRLILSTPQLHARLWRQQAETVALLAKSLCPTDRSMEFELLVVAGACLSAMTNAVDYWVRHPDAADLPDLIARGFGVLSEELSV
jgi:AcrR family transcriptional regulator